MHRFRRHGFRAFTLVELIVVVIVLGILMAIAVPSFLGSQQGAKSAAGTANVTLAYKAAKLAAVQSSSGDLRDMLAPAAQAAISASEPELSGTKHVSVSAGTGADKLTFTDDTSGVVGTLHADGTFTVAAGTAGGNVAIQVSLSGNEITDATRAAGLQGDGLTTPAGAGIWEGTTNLVTNGGFETNTTDWSTFSGTSMARDTGQFKFGATSLKVTSTASGNYGVANVSSLVSGATAGRVFTASEWFYGTGATIGRTYQFELLETGGAAGASGSISNGTIIAGWQRLTVTRTIVQNDRTIIQLNSYVQSAAGAGEFNYIDGVQIEQKSIATPYVETSGATASRAAALVTAPSSLLSATQGWVAMRVRVGVPLTNNNLFRWDNADSSESYVVFGAATGWSARKRAASVNIDANIPASPAIGDLATVIGYWDGTNIAISVNGSAFTKAAASVAAPDSANFAIGVRSTGVAQFDGNILWLATGTGTLSDANAASINSLPNTNPNFTPWLTTGVWNP